jgi:UDP-2-acetamido-3-amino-2,3-dideoxy-glucuronate N-acetyltransferase
MRNVFIHPSAVVDPGAQIGQGTKIWHFTHVQSGARIGSNCVLGQGVYVGDGVVIGRGVKVQNNVSVFHGVRIEDGVFIGPHVCFTNDKYPRAINHDGTPKSPDDWTVVPTLVRSGAALGAGSTIVAGVTIGRWALVAAGALVVSDVPDHGLVLGSPGKLAGYACICARRLVEDGPGLACPTCHRRYTRAKRVQLLASPGARHASAPPKPSRPVR